MRYFTILILVAILVSCTVKIKNENRQTNHLPKPIWGERLGAVGDFDGDKVADTLTERYLSHLTGNETNKYFDISYDSMVHFVMEQSPYGQVVANKVGWDTIKIDRGLRSQLFGLSLLKNIGDNNGNAKDEIAVVIDWADWSNVNTVSIMELDDKLMWKTKAILSIRDFDVPDSLIGRNAKGKLIVRSYSLSGERIDSLLVVEP